MSLKLFRATGYSTVLMPGETRLALHPTWMVLGVSGWIGLACNAALWQAVLHSRWHGVAQGLLHGVAIAACTGVVLSALCWRRTFKPVAAVLLVLAATLAAGAWTRGSPLEFTMAWPPEAWVLPDAASLMGWRVPLMFCALGVVPIVKVWHTPLRRLTGPAQLRANLRSLALALVVFSTAILISGMLRG